MAQRIIILVLFGCLLAGENAMPAQPTKVRISYSSRSNSNTPFQIALSKGFFAEEGKVWTWN
jgi:ABC-type nitrate/sulfonate/bicarbonate transport system substrate-binding protein